MHWKQPALTQCNADYLSGECDLTHFQMQVCLSLYFTNKYSFTFMLALVFPATWWKSNIQCDCIFVSISNSSWRKYLSAHMSSCLHQLLTRHVCLPFGAVQLSQSGEFVCLLRLIRVEFVVHQNNELKKPCCAAELGDNYGWIITMCNNFQLMNQL